MVVDAPASALSMLYSVSDMVVAAGESVRIGSGRIGEAMTTEVWVAAGGRTGKDGRWMLHQILS